MEKFEWNQGLQKNSKWWKDLKKVCENGIEGNWFHDSISWKVGIGSRILFWDDVWVINKVIYILKELFNLLHSNKNMSDCCISIFVLAYFLTVNIPPFHGRFMQSWTILKFLLVGFPLVWKVLVVLFMIRF